MTLRNAFDELATNSSYVGQIDVGPELFGDGTLATKNVTIDVTDCSAVLMTMGNTATKTPDYVAVSVSRFDDRDSWISAGGVYWADYDYAAQQINIPFDISFSRTGIWMLDVRGAKRLRISRPAQTQDVADALAADPPAYLLTKLRDYTGGRMTSVTVSNKLSVDPLTTAYASHITTTGASISWSTALTGNCRLYEADWNNATDSVAWLHIFAQSSMAQPAAGALAVRVVELPPRSSGTVTWGAAGKKMPGTQAGWCICATRDYAPTATPPAGIVVSLTYGPA